MCWFQGKHHKSLPVKNRLCLYKWTDLNPEWEVNILDNDSIASYAPEYFDIIEECKYKNKRGLSHHSDLLRLLLLKRYGGVWADASLYPATKLDDWLEDTINDTGFFSYRFSPRARNRETVSWFLAVNKPDHPLISAWRERFIDSFVNLENFTYFQLHKDLSYLYDTNPTVKNVIENMVQISQEIPHSAVPGRGGWEGRSPSYMYKRPTLPATFDGKHWELRPADPFIETL